MAKYVFKTTPRKYQVQALKKAVAAERFGLFMPMRSGKTKVAIDWASVLSQKFKVRRVLILTHTPTTFGVWKNEIAKHCPKNCVISVGVPQEKVPRGTEIHFLILNIQRVYDRKRTSGRSWDPVPSKMLMKWKPQAMIIDESTCIGNSSAVQTIFTYRLQKDCNIRFKLLLTGTPMHRNLLMTFGQFKVMDDTIFGTAFGAFKVQYALWGGHGGHKLLKYINVKTFRRKIEPYIYQLKRIPARPPQHQIIPFELDPREREMYDQMEKTSLATINDTTTLEAPLVLTQLLKQAQIAAGHIKDEDGNWHRVGSSLMDQGQALLQDLHDSEVKRVVIFARHIPELKDAALAAREAGYKTLIMYGKTSADQREQRIAAFHDPKPSPIAFISQISTGSMGIDLSAADTTIYWTLTESLLHKDQADARTLIHGQRRALTYYYLLPRNTILETMYLSLKSKMNLVEFVMNHPELVHRREIG